MSICSPRVSLLLIAGALCLSPAGDLGAGDDPVPGAYRVIDGKVDWGTYATVRNSISNGAECKDYWHAADVPEHWTNEPFAVAQGPGGIRHGQMQN